MTGLIILAFFNGYLVTIGRLMNGRLGINHGPMKASTWNHFVAFVFLGLVVACGFGGDTQVPWAEVPKWTFAGGCVGVVFVAISGFALARIGALRSFLLLVSAQMITSSLIDTLTGRTRSEVLQVSGISLVILGLYLTLKAREKQAPMQTPLQK